MSISANIAQKLIHHENFIVEIYTQNRITDSIEYAHFIWQKGVSTDYTKTYLLKY